MLKKGIGFFLACIGGMGGDGDNLLIPIAIILIGALLMTHEDW